MKIGEFFVMSAVMALMTSIVLLMSSGVTGIGFLIGIILLIYFITVLVVKGMWGFAGRIDKALSGGIGND